MDHDLGERRRAVWDSEWHQLQWHTSAKDGGKSYLHPRTVSISRFSARTEPLSGRIWIAGQPFPLSLTTAGIIEMVSRLWPLPVNIMTTSLRRLSIPIVLAASGCL